MAQPTKGHILVAEDYPTNQKVLLYHLQNGGFTTDLAQNGEEAVACFKKGKFDAVLMDVLMPVMDGMTATRQIREWERGVGSRVPIIAVSATMEEKEQADCRAAGMDDFLQKPVKREVLYEKLEQWISGKPSPQETEKTSAPSATDFPGRISDQNLPMNENSALVMYAGNREIMRKIAVQFVAMAERQIATIQTALEKQDAETIRGEAHSIKGAAQTLAADDLANVAWKLEKSAASGQLGQAPNQIDEVARQIQRLKTYTQQWGII